MQGVADALGVGAREWSGVAVSDVRVVEFVVAGGEHALLPVDDRVANVPRLRIGSLAISSAGDSTGVTGTLRRWASSQIASVDVPAKSFS